MVKKKVFGSYSIVYKYWHWFACLSQFNEIGIKCDYGTDVLKFKMYNGLQVL